MSDRSLSREQVDRLLQMIDRGEVDLNEGPARAFPPRQVDLGPVRGVLERWLEDLTRQLESWLILHVSNLATCSVGGLVPRTSRVQAPPAGISVIGSGDQEPILAVWDRDVIDVVIGGMLGFDFSTSTPAGPDEPRPLTEIDLRMLGRAANGLADALSLAWPRRDGRVFEVTQVTGDRGAIALQESNGPTMVASVVVRIRGEVVGSVEFAVPGWSARELRALAGPETEHVQGAPEMRAAVSELDLDLEVGVSVGRFTLRQILALNSGEELVLPSPPTALLRAGDVTVAEGVPGVVDGRWAVVVTPTEGEEDDGERT
jgi:hypothetical protein